MDFRGIEIDVLSQESIDQAKEKLPGVGVGPAVAQELSNMIAAGKLTQASQLPGEYAHLGSLFNVAA